MSMIMADATNDVPFDEADLKNIRLKFREDLLLWEQEYRQGAEGRKPFGKRHRVILEIGVELGYYKAEQVAKWLAKHRLGLGVE